MNLSRATISSALSPTFIIAAVIDIFVSQIPMVYSLWYFCIDMYSQGSNIDSAITFIGPDDALQWGKQFDFVFQIYLDTYSTRIANSRNQ